MPGVLRQPAPFIDSRSGKAAGSPRYFSVILTGASGTPSTFGVDIGLRCDASTGESPKRGRRGQKCRWRRHRTRPRGMDGCGRGTQPPMLGRLADDARYLAPAFEDLRVDIAPVRGEVDHEPRGDALVALDHPVGDVVPARHHGELVEDLVGDQRLALRIVARPQRVAQLVAQAGVAQVV